MAGSDSSMGKRAGSGTAGSVGTVLDVQVVGFRRGDGRLGIRNHLLVLPARGSASLAAARVAEAVPGSVAVAHDGRGAAEPEPERIARTLVGFATNPNVGAVLVVGVAADDAWLADALRDAGQRVAFVALAEHRGTLGAIAAGVPLAAALAEDIAHDMRTNGSLADIVLGLECGGSDALSGITANPGLGVASDLLVASGGASILAETPELIGAAEALAARAVSAEVAASVRRTILGFEAAIRELGVDVRGAQPSPGNQAGGLTTIEEKALGSAKKGGAAPVVGVVDFAEPVRAPGLFVMDTPGHDIEQMVGMVAGGAQVVAFTTGRGTPTGSPIAPCVKISTSTELYERLAGDIDLDAGGVLTGAESLDELGARILAMVAEVCNGRLTASERQGNREFALSRTVYA